MKTLSQLQADVCKVNAELEEISKGMAALQQSMGQDRPIDFCKIQALGTRYSIANHCLGSQPEAVQHPYLVLLAGLLLAEPAHAEDGWLLLQRIAAGGGVTRPLTDFQVDAATLTPEQMDRFSAEISHAGLTDPLLLDGLLLCLAIQGGRSAWDYLSGLVELLGCPAERLRRLAKFSVAVTEKNVEALSGILNEPGGVIFIPLLYWPSPILCKPFVFTPGPEQLWIEGDGRTPVQVDSLSELKTGKYSKIKIRNVYLSIRPVLIQFFENPVSITLENCVIAGIKGDIPSAFLCGACREINISGCVFQNLKAKGKGTLLLQADEKIRVQNTRFEWIDGNIAIAAPHNQFEHVIMQNITGFDVHGASTAVNCIYHDCKTTEFPNGFQKV